MKLQSVGEPAAFKVDSARVWKYTKDIAAMGTRRPGSPGHKKVEDYIIAHTKGDAVSDDAFTATTPVGQVKVRNIIDKFAGTADGVIVIAGHYDTTPPLPDTYVGANDGASSTAVLLEIADQLRERARGGKKLEGYSVWLLWTDGEEAFKQWTATDSIYGSRHIAEVWSKDGTMAKVKAFILADMIGDADLNVDYDQNSDPALQELVSQAAKSLGYESHFFARQLPMEDDHLPFKKAGVPTVDLIDFDYGYNNAYWHTPEDTIDKLSAHSLEITGNVILETVRLIDKNGGIPPLPPQQQQQSPSGP